LLSSVLAWDPVIVSDLEHDLLTPMIKARLRIPDSTAETPRTAWK
jgi:hypothetical protein